MSVRKFFGLVAATLLLLACLATSRAVAQQAGALAVFNNQTITLDDIDPRVRAQALGVEGEIAAARARLLEEQINALLFEAEARRRGVSVERLMEMEVAARITDPGEDNVRALYEANRARFGSMDLNAARPQIVGYLRSESGTRLTAELVTRLRKRYPVVMGADINSPRLAPNAPLATVAGRAIPASALAERLKPLAYEIQLRTYQTVKKATEQMINDLLILEEARRRGVGPEVIIRQEITDKLRAPSEEEITRFYQEKQSTISEDLATVRPQIVEYLAGQQREKLEKAFSERLRATASVRFMLAEPEQPVLDISTDDDPARGVLSAPVTVVVFSDFQCPSCGANHPMIEETTKAYGNQVRLVWRDFPLPQHEFARKAAEAANAANAQGKYFEYAELLYTRQKALDVAALKRYATEVGLNRARFDAALDSGAYAAEVAHDIADGQRYGVSATPTVYVNGVRVNELSADTLRAAIDRALAQKKRN